MKTTVLVIEDEPIISEMMCILLEMEGCKVISLSDTKLVQRKLETQDVSLILLDLALGSESGATLCRDIKAQAALQYIPVMLVSANSDLPAISAQCGADDHLAKPFDLNEFIQKIRLHTGQTRLSA